MISRLKIWKHEKIIYLLLFFIKKTMQELFDIYSKTQKFFKTDRTWSSLIQPLKEVVILFTKKKTNWI